MIETLVEIRHVEDFEEQGFYSKTYIGEDLRLNRLVAVKDIDATAIESNEAIEEYFEEAQRLSLAAHPRVLPVYFVGINNSVGDSNHGGPRIVTKYVKAGSLNQLLNAVYSNNRTLELGTIIRFAHDVIQGMIHLHSLDILHLDLKASNIFIGDDGKLILADFGQSKMLSDESIVKVDNLYPSILTPEAIRKRVGDKTTDIYQFGVLLYSLCNYDIYRKQIDDNYQVNTKVLRSLFKGDEPVDEVEKSEFQANMKRLSVDIRNGSFPDRKLHHFYVPKIIQDVINKCLEVRVEDRYQNFYEIQTDLNKLIISNQVQDLSQDLTTGRVGFSKKGNECYIDVTEVKGRFDMKAFKNNRAKNAFNNSGLTRTQLSRELQKAFNEI